MNNSDIQSLIAKGFLRQALEQLAANRPAAHALLGEYNRGHQAYMLNTIDYDDWSRIQSKLTMAALEMAATPIPTPEPIPGPPSNTGGTPPRSLRIFLSYAREDEEMKQRLHVFLAPLRRSGRVAVWHDSEILPGEEWDTAIKTEIAQADLILLLVSPDFLASDYIWQHEISKAMERHERKEASVVPVFLRPCDWQDMPFARVQGLPINTRSVTQYENADEAYLEIVQGIRRILETWGS